jgi:hypothetical protein
VTNLGQKRKGCTLTRTLLPQAVCDLATAFPDIGLDGTVVFVGSGRGRSSNDPLTFNVGN